MIKQLIILNIIFLLFCSFGCNKTFTANCMTDRYYSSSFHKYNNGYIDYIFETKYEGDELISPVDCIMFKQQYFNTTLIALTILFIRDHF